MGVVMETTEGLWKEEQWGDLVKQMGTHRGAGGSSRADGARCSWNTLKGVESGLVGAPIPPPLSPIPSGLCPLLTVSPFWPLAPWGPGSPLSPFSPCSPGGPMSPMRPG